jgi:hypothetical protein
MMLALVLLIRTVDARRLKPIHRNPDIPAPAIRDAPVISRLCIMQPDQGNSDPTALGRTESGANR